jgi:hypothetical protein
MDPNGIVDSKTDQNIVEICGLQIPRPAKMKPGPFSTPKEP